MSEKIIEFIPNNYVSKGQISINGTVYHNIPYEVTDEFTRIVEENQQLKEIEKEHQKINGELREELKYTVPIVEHNKIVSEKNKENQQLKEVIIEIKDRVTIKLGRFINEKDYIINDEVEIIEEEKAIKPFNELRTLTDGNKNETKLFYYCTDLERKINELIDAVNEIKRG